MSTGAAANQARSGWAADSRRSLQALATASARRGATDNDGNISASPGVAPTTDEAWYATGLGARDERRSAVDRFRQQPFRSSRWNGPRVVSSPRASSCAHIERRAE